MTSQHRASHSRHMEGPDDGLGTQIDHAHDGFLVDEEDQPEHIRRYMLKLRGRQALLDLLVRIESERQRELQGLLESDFAHLNCIQARIYCSGIAQFLSPFHFCCDILIVVSVSIYLLDIIAGFVWINLS
ncbi:unnamed protein product [Fraxinus pennsylvanica]|uniref:Uncharacterized protein n=1 Tax=Fraxinus pennsylvanica TaxID=56036 RepID=A0AAD2A5I0_9LAMI|nr:unnamed protein product [Fraxinus pennsylvanica]